MRSYRALLLLLAVAGPSPAAAQVAPEASDARPLNTAAMAREITNRYPRHYARAGVGGTVRLMAFIDEAGKPDSVRVTSSTGARELDAVAASVVRAARFAPARGSDGTAHAAWVELALSFGEPTARDAPRLADRFGTERALQTDAPRELRANRIETDVVVRLTIDSAGNVTDRAAPFTGCYPEAVAAALRAAQRFTFDPGSLSGAGPRNTVATVRFTADSVRLTLRGDSDPPPGPAAPSAERAASGGETRRPELRNAAMVQRALVASYPASLRAMGIGGEVTMWMYVDEEGRVTRRRVSVSSGNCDFDRAATDVARIMRFSPALKDGQPIAVWVEVPIRFTARR